MTYQEDVGVSVGGISVGVMVGAGGVKEEVGV